jgi:TRAP-type mannitol/chloroaromatic compound transport system substrate-binding protein
VPSVFINYRRADSGASAGRLTDDLKEQLRGVRVFRDVAEIHPGEDFRVAIEQELADTKVVLAVIGRSWLTLTGKNGKRRLDEPADLVVLELAAALKAKIRVIPVLVDGAQMPDAADLPEPIRDLAARQALEITDTRWHYDVEQLVKAVRRLLGGERKPARNWIIPALVVCVAVVIVGALVAVQMQPQRKEAAPEAKIEPPAPAPSTAKALRLRIQEVGGRADVIRRGALEKLVRSIDATDAGLRFERLPEGAVVPSAGVVDAVGRGTLDAALISPQLLYDKGKAFALLDGAPFGPEGEQYVSWRKSPVATETIELMYQRVGVVGVLCGVTGPHGDFWLRESVTKLEELRSLQVRSHGLYAALLETAGVKTVSASSTPGPMGAELSLDPWMPSTAGVWTTYAISHLGGSRSLDLVVNASRWKTLEAPAREAIVAACASNVRWTLEQSRAAVNKAIHEARARKIRVYLMPRGVTAALRRAWLETRSGLSGSDVTFSRLQASMEQFEDAAARPIASAYGL